MFSNSYSPYLFISALTALVTAVITWRRRSAPGAMPLFLMLVTTMIWAGANVMVLEVEDPSRKVFWFNILLVGSLLGTPAFWAFGVQFTNRQHWLTLRNVLLVSLIPVFSLFLVWLTDYHFLFYTAQQTTFPVAGETWTIIPGLFYWVYIAYAYLVIFFTFGLVAQAFHLASPAYRGQAGTILAGTLIPLVGNIAYTVFGGVGRGGVDPTPLLFTVMGVVYAFGLFRYRMFEVVPVARHTLVENMQDGVIVVDDQNRVVDVNPSALRWLNWKRSSPVGRDVRDLLEAWFEHYSSFPEHMYIETEVHASGKPENYFDLRIEPLTNEENKLTGRLIVFRDITRQKMAEKALRDAHDRLRLHLYEIERLQTELREQAIRDPLTGLFNRRYLEETLERELARAVREGGSIGICMADIDDFKSFNDQHGHKAGDLILQTLAGIFSSYSRSEDVVCRYGGEEFLILMPGAGMEVTSRRAEDWRRAFEQARIEFEGEFLSTTLSLGVAVFPQQGRTSDEVLKLADEAMYISKRKGKNQVSAAKAWG